MSVAGATPTNATGTLDQTFGAKWITDLALSYALRSRYSLTVGADNIFDVYPDRNLNPGDPQTSNGGHLEFRNLPVQRHFAVRVQRAVRLHATLARFLDVSK